MLVRVAGRIADAVIQRHHLAPRRAPSKILQHVAAYRQQPGAKLTLPAEAVHAAKRADERLLHQIVHIGVGRPRAREKARQRPGVTSDELGRRLFIARSPRCDQRGVVGCWNHVRLGHRAPGWWTWMGAKY